MGRFSLIALGEDGGSGTWWKLEGKYTLDAKTNIGVMEDANKKTSLLIERKLDNSLTLRGRFYGNGAGDLGLKIAF